ncbi:MAG: hypothetical protein ACAH17_00905 [Candidatus Paceibacterota bacterium]
MIKNLLLSILIYTISLAAVTAINPAVGFTVATYTGIALAQPLTIGLRLGLLMRGLNE